MEHGAEVGTANTESGTFVAFGQTWRLADFAAYNDAIDKMGAGTMNETRHVCTLQHLPHVGKWIAVCVTLCGDVGAPQEYEDDAWAIADRHMEVQGFEQNAAQNRSTRGQQ